MCIPLPFLPLYSGGKRGPLSLPGKQYLESWHYAGRGLTLGATLKRAGTAAPADMTITAGNRQQSIALLIKIPTGGGGARGTATYEAYLTGGTGTPFQTGTTAASVVLTSIGLTIAMPSGTYSDDNTYSGVVESWANLTPKTRLLSSVGVVSAQPTLLWQAQNGKPTIHSAGGSTGYLQDLTSDWAASVASGTDSDFTAFLVCKTDSATPGGVLAWLSFCSSSDADPVWYVAAKNGTNDYRTGKIDDAGSAANADGGALNTSYHVLGIIQHGTTVDLYVDGTVVYSGNAQNVGITTLDIVCMFGLLRNGVFTNAMVGAIGESITYNAALSAGEFAAVNGYLRSAWSL